MGIVIRAHVISQQRRFYFFRTISFCNCIFTWQAFSFGIEKIQTTSVAGYVGMIVVDTEVQDAHLGFGHTFFTPDRNDSLIEILTKYFIFFHHNLFKKIKGDT